MSETLVERLRAAELYPEYVYKLRHEAADEIERLSRLSSREAVVEECARLCDQGAQLTKSPMYVAACEEMAKGIRALAAPPSGMPGYEQDARRYRLLRQAVIRPDILKSLEDHDDPKTPEEFDAAIDAAIAASPPTPEQDT